MDGIFVVDDLWGDIVRGSAVKKGLKINSKISDGSMSV